MSPTVVFFFLFAKKQPWISANFLTVIEHIVLIEIVKYKVDPQLLWQFYREIHHH